MLGILSTSHLHSSLCVRPCNQQMIAEIEFKACNQIGQGNSAATVTEIQLIG